MAEPAKDAIENWMLTRYWHWWASQRTTTGYFEADVRALTDSSATLGRGAAKS